MQHFTLDWLEDVQQFMKTKYGYTPTAEEYMSWPVWERRAVYIDALAFLKKQRTFFSFDDVPDECKDGRMISIREPGVVWQCSYSNGKWVRFGSVHDSLYKE